MLWIFLFKIARTCTMSYLKNNSRSVLQSLAVLLIIGGNRGKPRSQVKTKNLEQGRTMVQLLVWFQNKKLKTVCYDMLLKNFRTCNGDIMAHNIATVSFWITANSTYWSVSLFVHSRSHMWCTTGFYFRSSNIQTTLKDCQVWATFWLVLAGELRNREKKMQEKLSNFLAPLELAS